MIKRVDVCSPACSFVRRAGANGFRCGLGLGKGGANEDGALVEGENFVDEAGVRNISGAELPRGW